jgi:hypothetical protein
MDLQHRTWTITRMGVVAVLAIVIGFAGVSAGGTQTSQQTPTRAAGAQTPAGTGVIAGTLVSADGGRPIRGGRVSLTGVGSAASSMGRSVTTDSLGAFSFTELPSGAYNLTASRPGYLDVVYGQRRPGTGRPGTPIQLADGQRLDRISLQIPRGGAISGTVRDEQGEPAFGQQVRVFKYVLRSGERALQGAGQTMTDDRGVFRVGVLSPGEYLVSAFPRDTMRDMAQEELMAAAETIAVTARAAGDEQALVNLKEQIARARDFQPIDDTGEGYAPVYYPGTTQLAGAQPVLIEVGQERSGVDLQLQLVRTARISGLVTTAEGTSLQGLTGVQVTLIDADQLVPGASVRSVRPGADGRFVFGAVPPGHYAVFARAGRIQPPADATASTEAGTALRKLGVGGAAQFWATADITVEGRSLSDLSLSLQRGMAVAGSLRVDGSSGQVVDFARVRLSLTPTGASAAVSDAFALVPVVAEANGRFAFPGVAPGKYRITVAGAPPAWAVKSATFGGRDALDFNLEVKPSEDQTDGVVTLTTRLGTLSGALQDPTGQPTAAYTIIVFASDSQYWTPQSRRIQAGRPATDGHYSFSNLPAGEYRLVAVTDIEPGQWFDPAYLRELAGAALPIALGDGERRVQDLRVK